MLWVVSLRNKNNMTGIKIDELRPIVKSLNEGSITYGKAIKLINERLVFSALEDNAELSGDNKRMARASKRVVNFYESFRLKSLHLMDDKEIKEYLRTYLGGNLNVNTLTLNELTEIMDSYAKMKVINSKYNICDCCNDDRIGSTKLWCCNICGKRQEEFYENEFNEL